MKTEAIETGSLPCALGGLAARGVAAEGTDDDAAAAAPTELERARSVFLQGSSLPMRWRLRQRFVVCESGFGLGTAFLATWEAWRRDPQRCERLVFLSIEQHPLCAADLARAHAGSPLSELALQLVAQWPLATPNLHTLAFENGCLQLLLAFGRPETLMRQWVASVDAFYLHAPAASGDELAPPAPFAAMRSLGRLAASGATFVARRASPALHDGLVAAGFELGAAALGEPRPGDCTVAQFAPRHAVSAPPGALHRHQGAREALVIGAGLAGCAAAWALAAQGWRSTLLDREPEPARAASGNEVGIFHGSFNVDDGPHARLHRASALQTQRLLAPWIATGRVRGQCQGVLRLETRLGDRAARDALAAQRLPRGYVDWLPQEAACAMTGIALASGGWWFPGGGWLAPRDYANALLADSDARWLGSVRVARLQHASGRWHALDAQGRTLASAPVVVLANALDACRLAGDGQLDALGAVRGQISSLASRPDATGGARLPHTRVPVAGAGYLLPASESHPAAECALRSVPPSAVALSVAPPCGPRIHFGSTSHADDGEAGLRLEDHRHNLAQLGRLCASDAAHWAALDWQGRVAWRAVTPDRLPLIGALVDLNALGHARRADRPRLVPRLRDAHGGLYVFSGLGSRGIGWAALGGQVLASWVSGAPCPVEADLRDALDPARYALRPPRAKRP